jgi:hypothetical protein
MRFLTEILAKAGITSNYVQLDTLAATPGGAPGRIVWNDVDGTLEFQMKGGNVTQQIGQELPVLVKHADNTGLTNGKVVYQFSSDGANVTVKYASASSETTASKTFGVMTEDATGGAKGFCTTFGYVRNINTSALTEGAMIWLSETPGEMTTTRPTQPAHGVVVGRCIRQHATEGVIFVSIQNGFELDELHDVLITSKANNDFIVYESATNLWKNKTISAVLGYTPANGANYLALTGGTLTGDLTLSGVNPRLYFTDTDNNPDYFISNTDGTFTVYDVTNSVGRFKIYSTGNAEFTGALSGTSATFSGIIAANSQTTATNGSINVESADPAIRFRVTGGTANSRIYEWRAVAAGGVNDIMQLRLWNDAQSSASTLFTVSPTGAAIFTANVTATQGIFSGSDAERVKMTRTSIGSWLLAISGSNRFSIYDVAGDAERISITSSGVIGVGNMNPFGGASGINGMHITSLSANSAFFRINNASYTGFDLIQGNDGVGYLWLRDNQMIQIGTNNTERIRVTNAGRIIVNNSVANDSGDRNLTIQGSLSATNNDVASINLTQVWNGVSYPAILAVQQDLSYGNASGIFVLKTSYWNGSSVVTSERLRVAALGQLKLSAYTSSTSFSGTAAGYLAFDSSGNVITVAGVAATDNTKLPLTGGALTGPLSITGNGSYLGDWGYKTLELNDTSGYAGIFFKNGNNIWINRRNGADNAMDWAYSTNASAQGTGTFVQKMRLASDEWWVSTYPNYKMRVVGGDVLEALNGTSATTLYLQYHSNTGGQVNISAGKFIFYSNGNLSVTGAISMATSGTSYIRMGQFPQSVSNSGEAWIGRAADRSTGSMTVQLGGSSNGSFFEVVDYGWTTVTLKVGMNDFSYKGNAVIHAGNIGSQSVSNAATLGGYSPNQTGGAYTIVQRDSNGYIQNSYFYTSGGGSERGTGISYVAGFNSSDYYIRSYTLQGLASAMSGVSMNINGNASTASGANGNFYIDDNYGNTIVGVYTSTRYQGVFAMGDAYKLPADGSSTGSLYGLAWSHPNAGGVASNLNTHGLLVMENGTFLAAISGSIRARDDVRAPAIYDSGSRVAISRGEGRNYVDYSRYVYNNGAYSGSGWNEPSDLGVRYANSAGSSTSTVYMNTQFQGSGSVNTSEGRCMSLRTDSGAGAAVNYAPVLHMAASDTMWQAQGTYGSSGNGTLYFRQGYAGNWGNWLTMISSANIGSQSVNYASTSGTASNLSGFDKTNPSFGAVYASNWFRAQGDCGLYSQDYGGHIRRALTGSYGNWETFGYNRNGWSGFLNLNNYNLNLMMNSSGDHGFYIENGPGWTFFFNRGNHCAGIGTDNTWSGDGLRVVKQISAEYGFTTWSDRRAKENITNITSALDKVLQMRGVYFNYIKDDAKVKRVGFIAQELQEVLPEVVNYADEIDEYNVNYGQIVSVLTEATKEQNDMIVSQATRIEQLELLVQQLINSNNGISN